MADTIPMWREFLQWHRPVGNWCHLRWSCALLGELAPGCGSREPQDEASNQKPPFSLPDLSCHGLELLFEMKCLRQAHDRMGGAFHLGQPSKWTRGLAAGSLAGIAS